MLYANFISTRTLRPIVPPLQGLRFLIDPEPRALPWAITYHPVGVEDNHT
jgi:hypothetical protein